MQGWDNFKSELRSLRQSIRFDDYSTISEANPPRTPMSRAAYSVGQAALDSLDAVDRALEAAQVGAGVRWGWRDGEREAS